MKKFISKVITALLVLTTFAIPILLVLCWTGAPNAVNLLLTSMVVLMYSGAHVTRNKKDIDNQKPEL